MVVIGSKSVDLFSLAVGVVNVTTSTDLNVFNVTSHLVGNTESTPLIDIHVNFLSFSVCEIKATFILSNWKLSTIAKLILVEASCFVVKNDFIGVTPLFSVVDSGVLNVFISAGFPVG